MGVKASHLATLLPYTKICIIMEDPINNAMGIMMATATFLINTDSKNDSENVKLAGMIQLQTLADNRQRNLSPRIW